jgi:phosphogluconate dehydratase
MKSYHAPGTCTFYGTANTNQMIMEVMGLHLPGASFVNPGTPLREAFTRAATRRALEITALTNDYTPVADILDERAFVNGIVGLNATGGSTNHTLHLIAMAAAAGITLTWEDMFEISEATPLMARVYPNGIADVNQFHAAGGMSFLIGELLKAELLHDDVRTVLGRGLEPYARPASLGEDGALQWGEAGGECRDRSVLRPSSEPFQPQGGLKFLKGNVGAAVIKISAVKPEHLTVEAPARVFTAQEAVRAAFEAGELDRDCICVVRFQGPRACGMPELHSLTPFLTVLQDRGFRVALVTDGRMSGASGRVPAAIHVSPEGADGGNIAKIRDGDRMRLDCLAGTLDVLEEGFAGRPAVKADLSANESGLGRELFRPFREMVSRSELGATVFPAHEGDAQ